MNKPLKTFLLVSISALLLSACGVTKPSNGTSQPIQDPVPPVQSETTESQKDPNTANNSLSNAANKIASTPSTGNSTTTKKSANDKELAREKQIEIDEKGNKHAKGTIFEGDHLPIYLYTIPGYHVTETKSGNELIVTSKNQTIKMTIAPLEKGSNLDDAKKKSIEEMKKVSGQVKEITTLKNDKFYENATILFAANSKQIESVYLLTIDGFPIKVTIDRPEKTDTALPYLQAMMKTIGVKG